MAAALEKAQRRIDQLEAQVARGSSRHQSDTGAEYVDFGHVEEAATRRCGREAWKPAIAFALGMTIKELNAWAEVGIFPADRLAQLDKLSEEQCASSSRQRWSKDDIDRLKELLVQNRSDFEAAVALTAELGRRIYETSVTYKRRRLFRETGWSVARQATNSS